MRPVVLTYAPTALDRDGIAAAQTTAGAGALTLNGVLVSSGVATMGNQQFVTAYSGGDIHTVTFTVTGTTIDGIAITDTITGVNATTVASTKSFYKVTGVTADGAVGTNVEIGVNGLGDSKAIPFDMYPTPFNVGIGCVISSTPTYTVQHTFDNPFAATFEPSAATWFNHDDTDLVGATANQNSNYAFGCRASRVRLTAGSGSGVTVTYTQAGP